jgi:H+-transporting ATPase
MFFKLNYGNGLQVFSTGVDKDLVSLLATIASNLENQDVINAAIVGILDDPKQVRG